MHSAIKVCALFIEESEFLRLVLEYSFIMKVLGTCFPNDIWYYLIQDDPNSSWNGQGTVFELKYFVQKINV